MLLCQITRGVCPARSIAQAVAAALHAGWQYQLIEGLGIIEAKQTAAALALAHQQDLLLCEDDIDVPPRIWCAVAATPAEVVYARCRMRNGQDNVYTAPDGTFLYTGTVLVRVPYAVLARLPQPVFEARRWCPTADGRDLVPGGVPRQPVGSDVGFWWHVRHLTPPVSIRELGRIGHLQHPLNARRYEGPCTIEAW